VFRRRVNGRLRRGGGRKATLMGLSEVGEPMSKPLRVLCLEDRPDDAALLERALRRGGLDVELRRVETEAAYLAGLAWPPDIILADYTLPQFSAPLALRALRHLNLNIPFIVVTGTVGEEYVVDCIRNGAADYLLKDRLGRLGPAVMRALEDRHRIEERLASAEALRESERRFRSLVKHAIYGIYRSTIDGRFVEVNDALVRMLGYASEAELIGLAVEDVYRQPSDRADLVGLYHAHSRVEGVEAEWVRKDGRPLAVRLSGRALTTAELPGGGFDMIVEDITERRVLEARTQQAQKMEALGRLAGGVAHDFNNLLTAILGFSELALRQVPAGDPLREDLKQIHAAGKNAAALTGQLLAVSRRQDIRPQTVDLRRVVDDVEKTFRRVIGEQTAVAVTGAGGTVLADPAQLQQIVMNLVVNAKDAMPKGGTLSIDVSCVPGAESGPEGPAAGEVVLSVTDTGCGMSDEVKDHLFEPFFTTKAKGKGTGLGLAATFAAVTQNNGQIDVDSQLGGGTTFRVRFPAVASSAGLPMAVESPRPLQVLARTVLLVDDEAPVRTLARRLLAGAGYQILEASGGHDALRLAAESHEPIHLLLTDVVMPDINGRDLSERIRRIRPEIAVLFMSGCTDEVLSTHGLHDPGTPLLQKPFTVDELLAAVYDSCASSPC
jgi:two-component system, cell cycle sensor histidine kinase and response regulator CckA